MKPQQVVSPGFEGKPTITFTIQPDNAAYWGHQIDQLSHYEMASMHRFAPAGHVVFTDWLLNEKFKSKFRRLGGMTPSMSKRLSRY